MRYTGKNPAAAAGFTLLETIMVVLISSVLLGAVLSMFVQYSNSFSQLSAQDAMNAEVSALFKVIEKDVMMAGYGLPTRTRIASFYNYSSVDANSGINHTDRLYVADGWQIIKAITDNNEDDGRIVNTPTNYLTYITTRKASAAGGYGTQLKTDSAAGSTTLSLLALNINAGEEFTVSATDFIQGNAFIIGDNARVEGHTIASVTPPDTVVAMATNPMKQLYQSAVNHTVVPAHVWYVRKDPDGQKFSDGSPVYWLYRNSYKVLPNVTDFKIKYGYDTNNDGIQWSNTVPPTNTGTTGGIYDESWAPNPDGIPYDFSSLKMIQISLTVKSAYKTSVKSNTYQTSILLRN